MDRADLLERIVELARMAGEYDAAIELLPDLRHLRESMGDRSGTALAIALESETIFSQRQRDRAAQVATEGLKAFEDMPDDENVLRLLGNLALASVMTRDYDTAREAVDRALAAAERLSMPELAARMLMVKGTMAQFQGRLWEAIALTEGARRVAEQHGLIDWVHRINGGLSNILALDDPKGAAAVEREIVEYARRAGRRENEIVTIGNMAEDLRRTGEWDWIIGELERATRDEDRNVTDLLLDAALIEYRIFRAEATTEDVEAVLSGVGKLEDLDVAESAHGIRAAVDLVSGRFTDAAVGWIQMAEGSDLNAPYALPKAGLAAVLGGDAATAQATLDRLGALGARGRAVEADMDAIRAGLAALAGDRAAAQTGLRDVRARYQELGLGWDVAYMGLVAAATLDPADPEIAGWIADARATFERLRARPFVSLLDRFSGRTDTPGGSGANRTGVGAGGAAGTGAAAAIGGPAGGGAGAVADQAESVSST